MAVVAKLYNKMPANTHGGETSGETATLDWISDTVVCLLLTSSYTPDRNAHEFISDVSANEATSVTNYSRASVSGKTISFNSGTRVNTYDCSDVTFSNLTGTFKYAVFARSTGSDATSALLCYVDLDDTGAAPPAPSGENFTLTIPATGLFTATPAA
jgi:hypothetical protein